jgi:hypothetical protein
VRWRHVYEHKLRRHAGAVVLLQRFVRRARWRRRRRVARAAAQVQRVCRGALARQWLVRMQAYLLPIDVAAPCVASGFCRSLLLLVLFRIWCSNWVLCADCGTLLSCTRRSAGHSLLRGALYE